MTTLTTTISNEADWSLSLDEGGGGADPRRVHDDDATGAPGANTRVNYAESETEDEEVKMNCIAGARGMEDSDMFTDCEGVDIDDGDDDDDDNSEGSDSEPEADENLVESSREGVVNFVTNRLRNAAPLVHPKATTPPARTLLSPLEEEENASDDSTESSVGARGVALSLGTESVSSESSTEDMDDSDDDDSDEEEVEEEQEEAIVSTGSAHHEVEDGYSGEKEDSELGDDEEDEDDFEHELSGLLETLDCIQDPSDQDEDVGSERQIGVTLDRDDIINLPKTKRVLSFNTLTALNTDIGIIRDSPKRSKVDAECGGCIPLVSFSLGLPAMTDDTTTTTAKDARLEFRFRHRRESPLVSSSDEEELDRQLEAELGDRDGNEVRGSSVGVDGGEGSRNSSSTTTRENSPVPLLTPPESPVMFEMNGDKNVTMCEWPSNLVVDSALTSVAISEIEPLTSSALEDFEREDAADRPAALASSLTPLLRGISVRDL